MLDLRGRTESGIRLTCCSGQDNETGPVIFDQTTHCGLLYRPATRNMNKIESKERIPSASEGLTKEKRTKGMGARLELRSPSPIPILLQYRVDRVADMNDILVSLEFVGGYCEMR